MSAPTPHPENWISVLVSWVGPAVAWATAGMNPLAVLATLLGIVYTLLRIREALLRDRYTPHAENRRGPVRRVVDALRTGPGRLED